MNDRESFPASARDALIAELLSDVGRLHDDIKGIPKLLQLSLKESLEIVANAVEDAEETAVLLQQTTKEAIHAATSKAALEVGVELTGAIHQSLERAFEPALQRASSKVEALEQRIVSMSGNVRDAQATRLNYLLLAGFVTLAVVMVSAMGWLAYKAQDVNETNKWFYEEYKAQHKIIESLPDDIKKKFNVL